MLYHACREGVLHGYACLPSSVCVHASAIEQNADLPKLAASRSMRDGGLKINMLCVLRSSVVLSTCLQASAAQDGRIQPEVLSPAPAETPQGANVGERQAGTPATAPRAADPSAFLRNTNTIFSPDMPAVPGKHQSMHCMQTPYQCRSFQYVRMQVSENSW